MDMLEVIKRRDLLNTESVKAEIARCNEISERFALSLSGEDIETLVVNRKLALKEAGRIEFGTGILPKLIFAFCDSPYIEKEDYVDILCQLQESFYYYKSMAEDAITDDELIEYMVRIFNGKAQGSIEYLVETSLEKLIREGEDESDSIPVAEWGGEFD